MKKLILILFLVSLVLISACNNGIVQTEDENVIGVNYTVDQIKDERIKYLFTKNGLNMEGLKVVSFTEERNVGVNHLNLTLIKFTQEYKGLPIFSSGLIYQFDSLDKLSYVGGNRITNLDIDINPKITKESAKRIIKSRANKLRPDIKLEDKDIILGVYNYNKGSSQLAYWVDNIVVVVISAYNGKILYEFDGIYT